MNRVAEHTSVHRVGETLSREVIVAGLVHPVTVRTFLALTLGACATVARGNVGVPIEAERVDMALRCAQLRMEAAGYFIGVRALTTVSVAGRREMPVGDEIQIDVLSFRIAPSTDGSMLLARASVESQSSIPDPIDVSKRRLTDLPLARPGARAFVKSLLDDCVSRR